MHSECAVDFFALLRGDIVIQIEYCLLPMCIRSVRRCCKAHSFVTFGKVNREIGGESLNEIISFDSQMEAAGEGQVRLCYCIQINLLDHTRISYDLLRINHINERLTDGDFTNLRHVKAINIVPPVNLIVLVLSIFNRCHEETTAIRIQDAIGFKPLIASEKNCIQHWLVEKAVAHPFRYYNVDLFDAIRKWNLFDFTLNQRDDVIKMIILDNLHSVVSDVGAFNGKYWNDFTIKLKVHWSC